MEHDRRGPILHPATESHLKYIQDVAGTVWAVFGHRSAIEGSRGRFLADLGSNEFESVEIRPGDAISRRDTRKPTEIKVTPDAQHERI